MVSLLLVLWSSMSVKLKTYSCSSVSTCHVLHPGITSRRSTTFRKHHVSYKENAECCHRFIAMVIYHLIPHLKSLSSYGSPSCVFLLIYSSVSCMRLGFFPPEQCVPLFFNHDSYQRRHPIIWQKQKSWSNNWDMSSEGVSFKKVLLLWGGCLGACQRALFGL